jgi:hypothetical protein
VAVPGGNLVLGGQGLDLPQAAEVYLATPDGVTEWNITAWGTAPPRVNEFTLRLPNTIGVPPVSAPPPGAYLVAVGRDVPRARTVPVPIALAARLDGVLAPPILTPNAAGLYTLNGAGFTPAATEIILDTIKLDKVPAAPAAGQFTVTAAGTQATFMLPLNLAQGRYHVRVRVNGIDSPPAWWIDVP